uniref:Lectin 2 n=1 Tax=Arisaema heterophyllum TaxID=227498 RepID=A0A858C175_9ARAE|nr:lectin 2 [Arisaema heterophyllum]
MEPATRSRHVALHLPLALPLVIILGTLSGLSVADQVLYPGFGLNTGQSIAMNSYVLMMQNDCNLVFYDGGHAVWASGSQGKGANCRVIMQRDGNLVIYSASGSPVWASNTARGSGFYALVMQSDRNLVMYGPAIWATGTNAMAAKDSIPKGAVLTSGVLLGGHPNVTARGAVAGEGSKN